MTPNSATKRRQQCREAQARYKKTAKGKAVEARYEASARRLASKAHKNATTNSRRTYIGQRYIGRAETAEQAAVINTHIRNRLHEFVERQSSRTQTESV